MTRTAPIRFKLPGLTRRLCVGARRRCRQNCARERNVYFAPMCMTLHSVLCPHQVATTLKAGIGTFVGPEFDADQHRRLSVGLAQHAPAAPAANHRSLILRVANIPQFAPDLGSESLATCRSLQSGLCLNRLTFLNILRFSSSWHATYVEGSRGRITACLRVQ